jgi:putative transposase
MVYVALLLGSLKRVFRPRSALLLENLALRQQLAVYQRRGGRPPAPRWDRCFWSLLARMWPDWRSPLLFVQPETVIRWHRTRGDSTGRGRAANECLVARELTRRSAS